ncbi:CaiB/BaiF CoA transferase family protein [Ramlibacter sp. MAHUQ-53]|uniref:CaiB/BaiF CoA transferase family protein n=1 Tax=unclassified Ramlibacter TaxID=2617605 RepID=UPI00362950BE
MLPLDGIRIIDFCNVVMGPYATQLLASYGADVIKIEPPEGDDSRRTGVSTEKDMASLFLGVNRGKRSLVLDLKDPASRPLLARLICSADVLVHNIRPQKLHALGLAADQARALNPRLVHVSLTGFGQDGPYGGKPAYDDIIQGMSGLAALAGRHGQRAPHYLPTIVADKTVGAMAAGAILAAVVRRERQGGGCTVEVPMFESIVSYTLVEHMHGRTFAGRDGTMGYPRALGRWRKPFATRDGYLCVMPYTDRHWRDLLHDAGRADLVDDPRFANIAARSEHTDFVYETLASLLALRPTADWLERLGALEIPAAAVCEPEDLPGDPHLQAVGYFQRIDDPVMGPLCFPGAPVLFDGVRPELGVPPRLGEHTEALIAELAGRPAPAAT